MRAGLLKRVAAGGGGAQKSMLRELMKLMASSPLKVLSPSSSAPENNSRKRLKKPALALPSPASISTSRATRITSASSIFPSAFSSNSRNKSATSSFARSSASCSEASSCLPFADNMELSVTYSLNCAASSLSKLPSPFASASSKCPATCFKKVWSSWPSPAPASTSRAAWKTSFLSILPSALASNSRNTSAMSSKCSSSSKSSSSSSSTTSCPSAFDPSTSATTWSVRWRKNASASTLSKLPSPLLSATAKWASM
mmetsp:Transcript_1810/g.5012  ORF Transcript_1810/g.5012 Transcript_1810/m.5012 type:complete len:256 (-) Transcript_1810:570-1337(-)